MNKTLKPFFLFASLFFLFLSCSQPSNPDDPKSIDNYLSEFHEAGQFNGNVLVVKKDQIIYDGSFGYSNGSKNEILNSDFRFAIGSIYKEFPAVAILQLEEAKQLEITNTIDQYFPELPDWSQKITIKDLLQYSSGLPQVGWDDYFSKNLPITVQDIENDLLAVSQLPFLPGEGYIYSNYNPFLLTRIVEQITGLSFQDYAAEKLFGPAGMENTFSPDQYPFQNHSRMALPFNEKYEHDDFEIKASSMLYCSTTRDLYNWIQAVDNFKLISKPSMKFLSQTANVEEENMQAPLGTVEWEGDVLKEHLHHGSSGNYEGVVWNFMDSDITLLILTNQKNKNLEEITTFLKEWALKE